MKNRVLEKFRNQQPSYGTFTHLKSMTVIEALGAAGLDYVVIDMEHSPTGITEVTNYITAAKAAGKPAFIFTGNAADTKLRIAQGFDSAMVSIDILMLVNAYKALLHEIEAGE